MRRVLLAIALGSGLGAAACTAEFPPLDTVPDQGSDAAVDLDAATGQQDQGERDDAAIDAEPIDGQLGDRGPQDPDAGSDALPPDLGGGGGEDAQVVDMALPEDAGSLCVAERCNGADDDCDGQIDENFPSLGEVCVRGRGACRAEGVQVCAAGQDAVICDADEISPAAESCDGRDNDCDGQVDEAEAFAGDCPLPCGGVGGRVCQNGLLACVGEDNAPQVELCFNDLDDDCDGLADEQPDGDCVVGQGLCARPGILDCNMAGPDGVAGCFGEVGPPEAELCDGLDNDCDGQADEAADFNGACQAGVGECRQPGTLLCPEGGGALVCDAVPSPPAAVDGCDGLDNDCDGGVDEAFQVGQPCTVGVGVCARPGVFVCADDESQRCDAEAGPPGAEACNGLDDDCDGRVDEGAGGLSPCGDWIAGRCRLWLGWVDNVRDPNGLGVRGDWGRCPGQDRDIQGSVACVSSRQNQRFQTINISGRMDDNDWLALRFECDADQPGDWIETRCQAALAYADVGNTGQVANLDPLACFTDTGNDDGDPRCVRTAGDRQFHPLQTRGGVNGDDVFGIGFRCSDPADPERAAAVERSVEVFFGLRDQDGLISSCPLGASYRDNEAGWGDCPGSLSDESGGTRCAGKAGGPGFAVVKPEDDVDSCEQMSVALRRAR